MLKQCLLQRCLVQYRSLMSVADKLNGMLDTRQGKGFTPRETLKNHLRSEVMPLLKGTKLDRRHDSITFRRSMSQLVRDAAFAAVVVHANPTGAFVTSLTECIKHDHERMRFISYMTSAQSSRVIAHLCKAGVRDSAALSPLISRLDFNELKEISRAMFALVEEGKCNEVIFLIVPMYCGEKWTLTYDAGRGHTNTENRNCNVFEAVRVLRVLSKAVRSVVERRRTDLEAQGSLSPLPIESIQRLRTSLANFIIENTQVLRGAHWINFTRAMMHFPQEFKLVKYLEDYSPVVRAVEALQLPNRGAGQQLIDTIDTTDLAALGMSRLFEPVKHMKRPQQSSESGMSEGPRGSILDVPPSELSKIIPIIEHLPSSKSIQQLRLQFVVDTVVKRLEFMNFADVVHFLHVLRNIEGSAQFSTSLDAAVNVASKRLLEAGPDCDVSSAPYRIPYARLVQLATLLSAFRVKSCVGFVTYLSYLAPTLRSLRVDDATAFMCALATIAPKDGQELCANVGKEILDRVGVDSERGGNAGLFMTFPISCVKLLRAVVILNTVPSSNFVSLMFGDTEGRTQFSEEFCVEETSVLFDVSRSLYHFSRMRPGDMAWNETLWSKGVMGFLLPLLHYLSSVWRDGLVSPAGKSPRVTYIPIAWRSAAETIFPFVDVNLDVISLKTMQARLEEVYPSCRDIILMAVDVADAQMRLREGDAVAGEPIAYSSNAFIHLVYFLLMVEHMIYHATWQAEMGGNTEDGATLREKMQELKGNYNTLISTSSIGKTGAQCGGATALSLLEKAFVQDGEDGGKSPFCLSRSEVLEITTNLPFALTLVVNQGPVNELFCERAVSIMVNVDD